MTTARMMTSLGAVALGLAMAGAVPALAATGSTANQTGGAAGMTAAQTNSTGGTNGAMSGGATTGNEGSNATAGRAHAHPMTRTGMTNGHHTTHRTHTAARRGALNPDAQNADVARLNEQSLQAAQQGRSFTPQGAHGKM